jgi:uncharacterized membrane protein YfcA
MVSKSTHARIGHRYRRIARGRIREAIAGGGGLISIPVLFSVFPTAPPATLFGTSKAAMVWGTACAADYSRHVRLPWHTILPACLAALTLKSVVPV